MTDAEELKYYNDVYSKSDEYRKEPLDSRYINIWKHILLLTGKEESIIEIGCGSGQLAKLLIENGRNYKEGFDYSEEAIKIAMKLNKGNQARFSVRDVYKEKEIVSDTVICTEVLEHLEDDFFIFSLLKKGSRFIFSVPDFWYKSHKRVFKSVNDITSRYIDVAIRSHKKHKTQGGNNIFVVDSFVK